MLIFKRGLSFVLLFFVTVVIIPFEFLYLWIWSIICKPKHNRCVLYFSQVVWGDVWQRPQELASYISREKQVIYFSGIQLHHLFQLHKYLRPIQKFDSNQLLVITPCLFSGHYKNRIIFDINQFLCKVIVKSIAKKFNAIDVITDSPYSLPLIEVLPKQMLFAFHYDIIDDFTAFSWSPSWGIPMNSSLLKQALSITTGTLSLAKKYCLDAANPLDFIPVGIDVDLFSNIEEMPLPDELRKHSNTQIIGYVGSINDRLDFRLITQIADRFRDAIILMIGPIRIQKDKLPNRKNIFWLGSREHRLLPAYMCHFTVAMIPFELNEGTFQLFPVKTMEYMACRVPVVSVRLPDVEAFFGKLVYTAFDSEDFCNIIERLLKKQIVSPLGQGRDFALSHTWKKMSKNIIEKIASF